MRRAVIVTRKLFDAPITHVVVIVEGMDVMTEREERVVCARVAETEKAEMVNKFPEFKKAEFTATLAELKE